MANDNNGERKRESKKMKLIKAILLYVERQKKEIFKSRVNKMSAHSYMFMCVNDNEQEQIR